MHVEMLADVSRVGPLDQKVLRTCTICGKKGISVTAYRPLPVMGPSPSVVTALLLGEFQARGTTSELQVS